MKAPKIKGYADGGPTKNVNPGSKMTPKEWDEFAASKGWKVIPTHSGDIGRHNQYYDPNLYSATPNEIGAGDGSSLTFTKTGNDPYDKPIMQYYFQEPPKQVKPLPNIDSNRKPLNFNNPGYVYDPNSNTYSSPGTGYGEKLSPIKYKKGGLVSKIMGYEDGGNVYDPNKPISGQGIIQQPGQTQIIPTGNAQNAQGFYSAQQGFNQNAPMSNTAQPVVNSANKNGKKPKTEQQLKNEATARGAANTVGNVLGGYGSAYYNSQIPTSEGDAARNAGLSAVSQTGPIGGAIGGISAIGDKIGKPIRKRSEQLDASGNLQNEDMAKRNAAIGITFSPSKRLSYEGGLTDVTGQKYIDSIEKKAQEQLATAQKENALAKRKSAVESRNSGEVGYKPKDIYDFQNTSFDENGNIILKPTGYNKGGLVNKIYGYADGGKIVGKGTAKADAISAKVKANSFVVPAENAKVAEEIREKVLIKSPKVKANLNQKGGENVKLSNGEHLFTPEEKAELETKGVDINKLAPNAENKNPVMFPNVIGLKKGGLSPHKAKIMLKEGEANGKPLTDAQKGYFGAVAGGDNYYKDGGKIKGKTYAELITVPREFKGSAADWKKAVDKAIAEGKVIPSDTKTTSVSKTTVKAPKVNMTADKLEPVQVTKIQETTPTGEVKDATIKETQPTLANTGVATKRNNFSGLLSRIDPTALAGVGQTAMGLNYLRGSERPTDTSKLDPTFNANVNRAQADAQFGFTPEQQFALEQSRQNALNDARFSARNFAGGNAGTAFNQERQAINQGWMNKLGLVTANQEERMRKQQYADQQVANRAAQQYNLSRTAYTDALGAFQQKQQAGSELIGAGIQNTIGALRYQQELDAMQKADAQRNAYLGGI